MMLFRTKTLILEIDNLSAGACVSRMLPTVGCHLAPGRYDIVADKDKIYNRVVSKRGPYDVFTADRGQPIKHGHFAVNVCLLRKFSVKFSFTVITDTSDKNQFKLFKCLWNV